MKNVLVAVKKIEKGHRAGQYALPVKGAHAEPVCVPHSAVIVNEKDGCAQVQADLVSSDERADAAVVNLPRGFKSKFAETGNKADAAAEEGLGHFTVELAAVADEPAPAPAA